MAITQVLLPALAFASVALAQSSTSSICAGPSFTITSNAEATQIADCSTYRGDIYIDSSASGQISLDGIEQITGDLTVNNATQLTAITSDKIGTIGGVFSLTGLTIMSTLQFDSLTRVNRINWVGLPALQSLNFAQGVSESNEIYISNTQLNNINGIELTAVGSLDINNNPYLTSVDVNALRNVTTALAFSANGRELEISFPNLRDAANLTFRDVSKIEMPSLANVGGSIGFYTDKFESFAAPNLTSTGGTLAFVDCPELNNLSFPSLELIGGGFLLANNTKLTAIRGFPQLATVVGALDFAGTFESVTLNSLSDVRGGSNVQTTSTNSTICDLFDTAHERGAIKGVNTCITGTETPQSNQSTTGTGSTPTGTGSSDHNGAGALAPVSFTGLAGLVAALLFI
ncbi:hypothetical protein PV10_08274 [Exophiala mesophila]|uniref:Protein ecm33 n=1 Tax=Exophiala mesophila TaxID=212818 RepID=A0A0D1Z1G3_EXOME|nr:uncharacterized protein PV10_08274 [Exophiala mesophila]KIV88607.1 hypothetical protein PV10_08274 [Exophiala mesophila]